jgi:hypothetical protein
MAAVINGDCESCPVHLAFDPWHLRISNIAARLREPVPNNRHLGIFDLISHLPDALEQEKTERTEVRGVLQLLTFIKPRFPPVQMKSCPKAAGAGISLNSKTEVKTYDPHRKTTDYADGTDFLKRIFQPNEALEKLGIDWNSIRKIRVIRGKSTLNSGSNIGFRAKPTQLTWLRSGQDKERRHCRRAEEKPMFERHRHRPWTALPHAPQE